MTRTAYEERLRQDGHIADFAKGRHCAGVVYPGRASFRMAGLVWILVISGIVRAQAPSADPYDQARAGTTVGGAGDKVGPGVRETLASEGSVRVVVALEAPASLKRPDRSRFPQIRHDVEASQNAVIGQLIAGEQSIRRRYRLVPAFASEIHTEAALDKLARHPLVVKVDLDEKVRANLAQSVPHIRADSMHAHGYTGKGVVVAVLDTGIDTDHPDLAGDLIHEECFMSGPYCHNGLNRQSGPGAAEDDHGHGTHVSGIITSAGIVSSVGVAPDAKIVAVKVLDAAGAGWTSDILAGLDWILEYRPDVSLVNMSLGAGLFTGECDFIAAFTVAFAEVTNGLRAAGVTTFAASGNDQSPYHLGMPACITGVVSVGATDDVDNVPRFSNTNPYLDLLAPGADVVSDAPDGTVATHSGTSMATPHAVGCAALQLEAGRATTPGSLEGWLKGTGVPVTDPKNGLSFPRVDCFAEPSFESSDELLAATGPPDGTGGCGGTGSYTVNVIGGTISRTGDTAFNNWAVGYSCWGFDEPYVRVYLVADDPATFDHWESPSGDLYLIDEHNGTSETTIETSFNLLGRSPTFQAVHTGGSPAPDLMGVDRYSGTGSIIGPLSGGSASVYPSIAVNPITKVVYAGGGNGAAVLHTVNPATGALTAIAAVGSGIERIAAMDFRSDGTLFASVKVSGTGGPGANYLATISTLSGAATLIGPFGTCGVRCSIEGMGAIAFDGGGTLYGALHERAQNGAPGLYTINTSTGTASFVAPIVDGSSNPPSGGITSLQFVDGTLYGGTAIAKNPPGDGGWLVAIDKTTGAFSKIGPSSTTGGRGLIGLTGPISGLGPPGDHLADATVVGALPYVGLGNNTNASPEPSEAFGSCASDHGNSIWWSFKPTVAGRYEVNTNGSSVNTGLSIWTGTGHPLTEIGCDDNLGEGTASMLRFDAAAGEEYFLRVIGLAGESGPIVINVFAPASLANDDLVSAISVMPLPSTVHGTNVGANREPDEELPSCAGDAGTAVWWKMTATETGRVYMDTEGSDFNTVLSIWTGSSHPLNEVACNDDKGVDASTYSWLTFDASAGESYYVRVSGSQGEEGEIVLNTTMAGLCVIQTDIPKDECEALIDLFVGTWGAHWRWKDGWLVTTTPCSWRGVSCLSGHVSRLDLMAYELFGTIPESIGDLSGLTVLNLAFNGLYADPSLGLTGPIPESIGTLSDLSELHLWDNNLTGPIPESIGNLSKLTVLGLENNHFTGSIPESIGDLSALRELRLGSNEFLQGPIPESIGNLSGLRVLDLHSDRLSGPIPEWLGNLSSLEELVLEVNDLTGPVPEWLGNLSKLSFFTAARNRLTGRIPPTLRTLDKPTGNLVLAYNNLEGTVPLPVAGIFSCNLTNNDPGLCVPDIPEYQVLARSGKVCGLPLDPTCEPIVHVDAKVILEGPYSGGAMKAKPAFSDHCPSSQPYANACFDGTPLDFDDPEVVSSPPDSVMDWILVSLRQGVTAESEVGGSERAAFLLTSGSIVDTNGTMLAFPGVAPGPYRLVVRHRNHASVMSADTLDLSDGIGSWDFTTAMTRAYSPGGNPMKDLHDGRFGMFACDINADGQITALDFTAWLASTTAGAHGYEQPDCNMDGIVTAIDFTKWLANTTAGASSKVPE